MSRADSAACRRCGCSPCQAGAADGGVKFTKRYFNKRANRPASCYDTTPSWKMARGGITGRGQNRNQTRRLGWQRARPSHCATCASPSPVPATAQTWPFSCTSPSRARSVAPASATRSHSTARPRASRPSHSSMPPTQQGSCATADASRDGRCASTTVDTTRPVSTWACFLTIRAARAAAIAALPTVAAASTAASTTRASWARAVSTSRLEPTPPSRPARQAETSALTLRPLPAACTHRLCPQPLLAWQPSTR